VFLLNICRRPNCSFGEQRVPPGKVWRHFFMGFYFVLKGRGISSIWFVGWSVLLAYGWCLPNHYPPWSSFYCEAWAALVLLAVVPWAVVRAPAGFPSDTFFLSICFAIPIPFIQFAFGQIAFFGHAWIGSLYLIGLLIAIWTGYSWEKVNPGRLIDMLCVALASASLLSVFLQLHQWLSITGLGVWLNETDPTRPAANLGQPNQLATLLLWGVLTAWWGWEKSKIGPVVATSLVLILLFGVALTGSRTAWLAVALIALAGWWWRGMWRSKYLPWAIATLALYFVLCVAALHYFGTQNRFEQTAVTRDLRLAAWQQFVGAVLERPLLGYGWGQTAGAYILVSEKNPALHVVFSQAHNLFLDLVLWCGLPLGGLFSLAILNRFWRMFRQVNRADEAVLCLFLLVVANHALLEFPLHYAYFLLPAGVILGVFYARETNVRAVFILHKRAYAILALISMLMLLVSLRDYFRIENSYRLLRIEWAGFKLEADPQPPSVIALNQWSRAISHARVVPRAGISESELEEMRQTVLLVHKPVDFRVLAGALSLNGKVAESTLWLTRMCNVGVEENCSGDDTQPNNRKQ
jgi:O-antigen ligase